MNKLVQKLLYGDNLPRVIDPHTHQVLDFLVTGYFLMLAGAFWGRHRRASATALINGIAVLGATMLTDYDGDGSRPMSFPMHGEFDIAQAGMAAGLPVLLGFAGSSEAMPFQGQALSEGVVVAATDWEATGRTEVEFRAA
jgi:hypothetical protein